MMKCLIATLTALTTLTANAQNCLGEAQIIARVSNVTPISSGRCVAQIKASDIRFFSENGLCPLQLDEVLVQGVLISADNLQCSLGAGHDINGVIVMKADGKIVLE